ncbi:hypothetical protein ACFYWO_12790 [Streptomyces sp. NPDC002932]|uniref:hypothetical protein n=1 Tax=Streptomyces sp. NPDC002932 TaxID=3364672 RepID=UPI0036CFDA48
MAGPHLDDEPAEHRRFTHYLEALEAVTAVSCRSRTGPADLIRVLTMFSALFAGSGTQGDAYRRPRPSHRSPVGR